MTSPGIEIASSWQARIDDRAGPDGCWPWTGRVSDGGYGRSRVKEDGQWRTAGAHQIAHYVATGHWERKSDGRLVRHLCHNRRCCNPAHLCGGTALDNAFDRAARVAGRRLVPRVRPPWVLVCAGVANDVHGFYRRSPA